MDENERAERDEFLRRLRDEWKSMWKERLDDKVNGEGVALRSYPLVFTDPGHVIFATRNAKAPSLPEAIEYWRIRGRVYSPETSSGGWGKFIRTELKKTAHSRAKTFKQDKPQRNKGKRQPKKGGRGWLHKQT